jgi:hypothetical protein
MLALNATRNLTSASSLVRELLWFCHHENNVTPETNRRHRCPCHEPIRQE